MLDRIFPFCDGMSTNQPTPQNLSVALFLDRDGVINIDKNYLYRTEDFEFMSGVIPLMQQAQSQGFVLVVVTNQSGIGRGYYADEDFQTLTQWMCAHLAEHSIQIAAVYHCPHQPDQDCNCRKPRAGMLLQAEQDLGIDLANSIMVGDKESDVEAAYAAGLRRCIRFAPTGTSSAATYVTDDFDQISQWVRTIGA